jgi:CMP-N-acetylneuraminic acid synthetase
MLAIIPAKKNSTRLKNKNLRLLNNKPLIQYSIEAAKKSKLISRIIVSTDSKKIANLAIKLGAEAPFLRPKKYSTKNASTRDVCCHAVKFLEKKEKLMIKEIIILQPTSPLRSSQDIDKAIKLFRRSKRNYLTSFTKVKPFEWFFHKNTVNGFSKILPSKSKNSQTIKQAYLLNGSIYIMKREIFFGKKINFKNIKGIEIPFERSVDIDDIDEFKLASNLLNY